MREAIPRQAAPAEASSCADTPDSPDVIGYSALQVGFGPSTDTLPVVGSPSADQCSHLTA